MIESACKHTDVFCIMNKEQQTVKLYIENKEAEECTLRNERCCNTGSVLEPAVI